MTKAVVKGQSKYEKIVLYNTIFKCCKILGSHCKCKVIAYSNET